MFTRLLLLFLGVAGLAHHGNGPPHNGSDPPKDDGGDPTSRNRTGGPAGNLGELSRGIDGNLDRAENATPGQSGDQRRPGTPPPRITVGTVRPSQAPVDAMREVGWPRNAEGRVSARGFLYDDTGANVYGRTLQARNDGDIFDTPDLREPWRSGNRTTTWHIEGGVASYMRNGGPTEATLYLNIPPCGRDGDEARCHVNLPAILPRGSTLTVFVVRKNGRVDHHVYRGTGEGIR